MPTRTIRKEDVVSLLVRRQGLKSLTIKCEHVGGATLFSLLYSKRLLRIGYADSKVTTDILDRCGLVDLRCEYHPSRLTPGLGVKFDSMLLPDFDTWFRGILETKHEIFVDTNIIIYRTLSRVLSRRLSSFKEITRRIRIPRLVLLELESKYNRARKKYAEAIDRKESISSYKSTGQRSSKDLDKQQSDLKKIERVLEKHEMEIRLMISAQIEVQILKSLSATTTLLPLNTDLLAAFHKQAGEGFADAFIRKEILDSTGGGGQASNAVLLTRDLMNALAACAENLDTFYFSPATPRQMEFEVNDDQIADVLVESAITFGKVQITGLVPRKIATFEGMWPTKSNIDWLEGRIRLQL